MAFDPDAYLKEESSPSSGEFNPDDYLSESAEVEPSLLEEFKTGVIDLVQGYDSVTGAPTRAAVNAYQKGEDPGAAFADQFGQFEGAPTGEDLAKNAGIDDAEPVVNMKAGQLMDFIGRGNPSMEPIFMGLRKLVPGIEETDINPTKADLAGFGADVLLDPTNLVTAGGGAALRATGKGALGAGKLAVKAPVAVAKKVPVAGKVVGAAENFTKDAAGALVKMFDPSIAPDYEDLLRIADKNNIPRDVLPDSIEFGPSSIVTRSMRQKAEGPLGEPILEKFYQGLDETQGALTRKIEQISGGEILGPVEAGELLRDGFNRGLADKFSKIDASHGKFLQVLPGARLNDNGILKIGRKLQELDKWADETLRRGNDAARAQAKQMKRTIKTIRQANPTYLDIYDIMRNNVGADAFSTLGTGAKVPPNQQKLADLYFTMNDSLLGTVEDFAGKEVADLIRAENKKVSKLLDEKNLISRVVKNQKIAPEKVFQRLVENGDTKTVNALKEILPREDFQRLKGAFLEARKLEDAEGNFRFKTYHNRLRSKRNAMGALFEPEEINDIDEIIQLGARFGDPTLSSSGTGASNIFSDLYAGTSSAIANDTVVDLIKARARSKVPKNQRIDQKTVKAFEGLYAFSPAVARSFYNQTIEEKGNIKGRDKWALDGLNKFISYGSPIFKDEENVEFFLDNPKSRKLLEEASGVKPGSRRMKAIYKELESMVNDGAASN